MNKQIIKQLIFSMMLMMGLFFSLNTYADDTNVTVADLNSAYDYYNNVQQQNSNTTTSPSNTRPSNTRSATTVQPGGFGGMASNLMQPVSILSGFLSGMSLVIGMACLFGGFVRYMQYRVNPLAHPISTVITLLVLGVLLVLLPLVYKLTESAI